VARACYGASTQPGVARPTVSFLLAAFESEPSSRGVWRRRQWREGRVTATGDQVAEPGDMRAGALPPHWATIYYRRRQRRRRS
jgi:hypothetical protein